MNHLTETEVKIFTPDLDAIRARLVGAGAALKKPRVFEYNVRYEDAAHTLGPREIVLRLRRDSGVRLTYKAPPPSGADLPPGVRTRFEAEVTVSNFETMDLILQRLGYHPQVVYEKYRTTYTLGEAEIVLDEMPFGTFTEIEGEAPAIEAALAALDLGRAPRIFASYLVLFEIVRRRLGLNVHDLTFANFDGVTVPPDVFGSAGQ